MEYIEHRAYCHKQGQEFTLCKFWIGDNGEIDQDNLPSSKGIAELLQALRLYEVHIEFTGRVEND